MSSGFCDVKRIHRKIAGFFGWIHRWRSTGDLAREAQKLSTATKPWHACEYRITGEESVGGKFDVEISVERKIGISG